MSDTNAGPVLPLAPELRVKLRNSGYLTWSQARECDQNIRADIEAYGLQCWNACDEQVAGPLREELAAVLSDWNSLVQAIGSPTNGGAVAHARMLRERVAELETELIGTRTIRDCVRRERDRLRAESVIEWEAGRSYTAAELLRRAIRGLHVRKGRPLWPAVMNLCGVGSNVGHHLCRWAGRDPDTGAELKETPK